MKYQIILLVFMANKLNAAANFRFNDAAATRNLCDNLIQKHKALISLPKNNLSKDCEKIGKTLLGTASQIITFDMTLGAYLLTENVNRPAFADLMFDLANNKRSEFIELNKFVNLSKTGAIEMDTNCGCLFCICWDSVDDLKADKSVDWLFEEKLKQELKYKKQILNAVHICERQYVDNYKFINFIQQQLLPQSDETAKELVENIITLKNLRTVHGDLGEFIFHNNLIFDDSDFNNFH